LIGLEIGSELNQMRTPVIKPDSELLAKLDLTLRVTKLRNVRLTLREVGFALSSATWVSALMVWVRREIKDASNEGSEESE
jgi:hypothetical protein